MSQYCRHTDQINQVTPSARGCEECLAIDSVWVHLRLCRSCGHVGCCDDSPNRHATAHHHATRHPIIEGYDPPEGWGLVGSGTAGSDAAAGADSAVCVSGAAWRSAVAAGLRGGAGNRESGLGNRKSGFRAFDCRWLGRCALAPACCACWLARQICVVRAHTRTLTAANAPSVVLRSAVWRTDSLAAGGCPGRAGCGIRRVVRCPRQ